jgi:hypothetical protein
LRQWVTPSSTRLSPITPSRQCHLHFFGNRGIRLPRTGVRRPGTAPVSQALPWALAWSTILYRSPHTGSPSFYSRAGRHLGTGCPEPSDERYVPVPMVPHTAKTDPARKTGGIVSHRGRPRVKVPLPASPKAPPYQQRYGVIIDGPMQFAFADPLVLPASGSDSLFVAEPILSRASHLAAGRGPDTPVTRGSVALSPLTMVPSAS